MKNNKILEIFNNWFCTGLPVWIVGNIRQYCIFQSKTYDVWDTIFHFENLITSNFGDNANLNVTEENNWIKIKNNTSSNQWESFKVNGQGSGYLDPSSNYRITFDFKLVVGNTILVSICGNSVPFTATTVDVEHSLVVELVNGTFSIYLDGSTNPMRTTSGGTDTNCGFRLSANAEFLIRNFKLYSI